MMFANEDDLAALIDLAYRARCQCADWVLFETDDLCLVKQALVARLEDQLDDVVTTLEALLAEIVTVGND
jgi:hypothetical protein